MKTPFTSEQFFDVLKNYNETIFPLQFLFYFLALLAIFILIKGFKNSGRSIGLILSFFWLWMVVVYHLLFFTSINKAAYAFGLLFILQAIIFLSFSVIKNKMIFSFKTDARGIFGSLMLLYALLIYPVLGYFNGHIYPYSPTFGLPCPTTIFTFGFLLFSVKKLPLYIFIVPVIWSVIGFTAAFKFGIKEDIGLLISSAITLLLFYLPGRKHIEKISTVN